jgi:hypothetical protein
MPITFTKHQNKQICLLAQWKIADLNQLANTLAWLYVRKPRHAAKIIAKLAPGAAAFPGREFEAARKLLTVNTSDIANDLTSADAIVRRKAEDKRDTRVEHRDGLLFQHVSWIAAHIQFPQSHLSAPHVRTADKGFDGVVIQINTETSLGSVILCEDKATTNPRNLVTQSIWKELANIHKGDKDLEIHDAVTALLDKIDGVDSERALQGTSWDKLRHYRVALTAPDSQKKNDSFSHIFAGFDKVATGDLSTRIAEYIALSNVRTFLDDLAKRVIVALDDLEIGTHV